MNRLGSISSNWCSCCLNLRTYLFRSKCYRLGLCIYLSTTNYLRLWNIGNWGIYYLICNNRASLWQRTLNCGRSYNWGSCNRWWWCQFSLHWRNRLHWCLNYLNRWWCLNLSNLGGISLLYSNLLIILLWLFLKLNKILYIIYDLLSCLCNVFYSFLIFFYRNVLYLFFLDCLRNIFNIILNCLIFSHLSSDWHLHLSSYLFIFHNSPFIWNILNSRFPSYYLSGLILYISTYTDYPKN